MTDADRETARALVKSKTFGALATIARDGGHPFATLVGFALVGAAPVFLLSALAEHTRNLLLDARASLLVTDDGEAGDPRGFAERGAERSGALTIDPLARGRVTLVGRCAEVARDEVAAPYLLRHPRAAQYLTMKDFGFWRLAVENARYVGGFGKMGWIDGAAWSA